MDRFNSSRTKNDKRQKMIFIFCNIFVAIMLFSTIFMATTKKMNVNESLSDGEMSCSTVSKAYSSYAVMEAGRNILLEGNNVSVRLPMASTTKIMTAYIACTSGKLNDVVQIPKAVVGVEGSSVYLKEGEKYKLIDLVYGLMLQSGNDAAEAIAHYLGGSISGFAKIMNDCAQKMGLKQTHFVNPHGLHDDEHYTSAYDLAYITCEGLKNADFAKICGTKAYKFQLESGENKCYLNKNKLLSLYEGCVGVKTGYTKKAGRCLVSAAKKNNVTIVSVVLNEYDMWNKSMSNLNRGFSQTQNIVLAKGGEIFLSVKSPNGQILNLGFREDVNWTALKNEKIDITYEVNLKKNLKNEVKKGEIIGEIEFFNNKHLIFKEKIYTM